MADRDEIHKIDQLAAAMENTGAMLDVISKTQAEEALNLVRDGFRNETDPYGTAWEPKQAADGRKTLSGPTSRLKGGWHVVSAGPTGFQIAPSVKYAAPHQKPKTKPGGGLKRPRRMMVPDADLGLPKSWADAFEQIAEDALDSVLSNAFKLPDLFVRRKKRVKVSARRQTFLEKVKNRVYARVRVISAIKSKVREDMRRSVKR